MRAQSFFTAGTHPRPWVAGASTTALTVDAATPARAVYGSDGRTHARLAEPLVNQVINFGR
jgi:hypothetical protein